MISDGIVHVSTHRQDASSALLALLYALAIAGYPVVSGIALLLHMETRVSSIAYRAVVVFLTLITVLRWLVLRKKICLPWELIPLFLLWGVMLFRLAWDSWVMSLSAPWKAWEELLIFTAGVAMLPAMAFLERPMQSTLRSARKLTEVLGVTALTLVAILGFGSFTSATAYFRLSTETLNPIALGHLALSVFLLTIVEVVGANAQDSGLRQGKLSAGRILTGCGVMALSLVMLVAAASKGPLVAGGITLLLLVFGWPGTARGLQLGGRAIAITLVFILGYWTMLVLENETSLRPLERIVGSGEDGSTIGRVLVMEAAISQFLDSPILGSAVYEARSGMYPHNILVESLMATGAIGFLLLVLVIVMCSRAAWHLIRTRHAGTWVGLLYFQYLVATMLSTSMFEATQLWALSVAVLVIDNCARQQAIQNENEMGLQSMQGCALSN